MNAPAKQKTSAFKLWLTMAMDEIVKLFEPMGKADGAILADIIETWEPERNKERCVTDSKTVFFYPPD